VIGETPDRDQYVKTHYGRDRQDLTVRRGAECGTAGFEGAADGHCRGDQAARMDGSSNRDHDGDRDDPPAGGQRHRDAHMLGNQPKRNAPNGAIPTKTNE